MIHPHTHTNTHTYTETNTQTLGGHVGTARLKMGNPVALSPCVYPIPSSGLTAYLCVCACVGMLLFACLCVFVFDSVCVRDLDTEPHKGDPCALPPPRLLNNLTRCRHRSDDKGRMFAPRDAMETASRPHLTDADKHTRAHSCTGRKLGLYIQTRTNRHTNI